MIEMQQDLFQLLNFYSDVCEENDLKYFITGGTLLGAVRHKGFIPWDDDIDVAMPIEDYNRFLSLEYDLPEGIIVQTEDTDDDYPFFFAELCNTKIEFKTENIYAPAGIYMDIFPLIPSRKPDMFSAAVFNIVSIIGYILQVKCKRAALRPYKKYYARLVFNCLSLLDRKRLISLRRRLVSILYKENTGYCFSPGGGHKGIVEFFCNSWFSSEVNMQFENKEFPAPCGWNDILKQLYGDYMIQPDEKYRKLQH